MNLSRVAVKRPIATCAVLLLIMVIGIVSLIQTPMDLLPDIDPPVLAIITVFPGSAPQETLSLVTEPIEDLASAISGLTTLYSISQESLSLVILQFRWGTSVGDLRDDVSSRLDLISLPEGVQRPIILEFDPTLLPIMQVSVSGSDDLMMLTNHANNLIAPRLERIPGVASVRVEGGVSRDLFIRLSPKSIEDKGLSFDMVTDILRASLLDIPAGIRDIDDKNVRLRFVGRTPDVNTVENLVVGFNMDETALKTLLAKSINIDLKEYLSIDDFPQLSPEDIPMRAIYLKDIAEIKLDEENNYLILTPSATLSELNNGVSSDIVSLLPENLRQYLDPLIPSPEEHGPNQIIFPIPGDTVIDPELVGDTVINYVPDFEKLVGQIQKEVSDELDTASQIIEDSFTELALTYILSQAGMGGNPQIFAEDMPLIPVFLHSIADIELDVHPTDTISRINRQPSVSLVVQKEGEANTVAVTREARNILNDIANDFAVDGEDILFNYPLDQGREVEIALVDLAWALLGGAFLAITVLLIFLRNWRTTLMIGLSIPSAVIFTFSILYFTNMTINLMTLGGLALAAGMLVDNAIVVSENIFRHFQMGKSPSESAIIGSNEVAGAITASTLTTLSVFFPVVFLSGIAGELFGEFAITVSCALLASLIIALTVIPMMASIFLVSNQASEKASSTRLPIYRRILHKSLKYRWVVIAGAILFMILGVTIYPLIGTDLFPIPEESSFSIDITLPAGTSLAKTDEYVAELETIIEKHDEISYFSVRVGDAGFFGMAFETGMTNQARVRARLHSESVKNIDSLISSIRDEALTLPQEAELVFNRETLLDVSGMEVRLELDIEGDSLDTVRDISAQVAEKLTEMPSLTDVKSLMEEDRPEIHININQQKALEKGITNYQIAMAIRQALQGVPVARIQSEDELFNLIIGYRDDEVSTLEDIEKLSVYTTTGGHIQLGEVATLSESYGPLSIPRKNKQVIGQVHSQYRGLDLGTAIQEALKEVEDIELPPGYKIEATGTSTIMEDAFSELELVFFVAALLVYLVMAAQFESLIHPFIIICSLPLAFTGAISALYITGNSLSVPAMIGGIVLAGILVNDGIIMVDFINQQQRDHGLPLKEAIIEGATSRLRPILMTTITTILGLTPLAFAIGQGSQIQAPMAIAIIGGQITGTLLLLVVIPVIYIVVSKRKDKAEPQE